jgi:hypothetical protein
LNLLFSFSDDDTDVESFSDPAAIQRFSSAKHPICLESIKGTVLEAAESMLRTVSELILVNAAHDTGRTFIILKKISFGWTSFKNFIVELMSSIHVL